jgi:hypothetical protein
VRRLRRRSKLAAALAAAASLAAAPSAADRLPLACDPDGGGYASGGYQDSEGGNWVSDAFVACHTPEFWTGVQSYDDDLPFTYVEHGTIRSDGTSVVARAELELGFPEDASASIAVMASGHGFFIVPAGGKVPAKLGFEISRGGVALVTLVHAAVAGPGLDRVFVLDELADGVHEFDALLQPGATYHFYLDVTGNLAVPGSGFSEARFYVAVPEPSSPLLAAVGAAVLALTTRRRGWTTRSAR